MTQTCEQCKKTFDSEEALQAHNRAKHQELVKKQFLTPGRKKRIKTWLTVVIILTVMIGLISFFVANVESLPPRDIQGHREISPQSHILKEPMPIVIHKHMLEHADGKEGGRGGVIINYNCEDFNCEDGLIEKLETFAIKYPVHVYVAPYPKMDAKIVLTKLNQQKIMEEYDEDLIDSFAR